MDPDPYPDPYWPTSGSTGSGSVKNEYGSETLLATIPFRNNKIIIFSAHQPSCPSPYDKRTLKNVPEAAVHLDPVLLRGPHILLPDLAPEGLGQDHVFHADDVTLKVKKKSSLNMI